MKLFKRIMWAWMLCILPVSIAFSFPVEFVDDSGTACVLKGKPARVVSLVPTVTEIIYRLGAQDALKGITYHSTFPGETAEKTVVGGFFEPSVKAVIALNPDVVFVSSLHTKVKEHFKHKKVQLIELGTGSVNDGIRHIELLGRMFDKEEKAKAIIAEVKTDIALVSKKLEKIKPDEKLRVMRLMGRDRVMTPGSDSFQNELIQMAGGISHDFDRNGKVITVEKEEFMGFNPQVLYGCGKDSEVEKLILSGPGWKDVDAVKNGRVYYFPCNLTCRAATHTGYFVQWLAASIYGKQFAKADNLFFESGVTASKNLSSNLTYVQKIQVQDSRILDFANKSLVIELNTPMTVVSTLEGQRQGITAIVNHYTPPQNWQLDHDHGIDAIRERICTALKKDQKQTSILMTGANMDHLSVKKASFRDLEVHAFVTAGVQSNAMRMGKSVGLYYEPGTINIILMTNMRLSARAMTRAIITATEAKTAALLDMDIRTSYDDGAFRATGTGTDNVLVVQGTGRLLENSGGHTKLGQLMAQVVYEGVTEAVFRQNGLSAKRNIFQRLKKRGITIYSLIAKENCDCGRSKSRFVGDVEELLLKPRYAGFIRTALTVSDDYEKGLITDLSAFEDFSKQMAEEISGKKVEALKPIIQKDLPRVIHTALNALFNGIYHRSY